MTKKYCLGQVNLRLNSQLINEISVVLEKLLRYFNGISISTSFVPLFPICPVIYGLNFNEILLLSLGKSIILPLLFKAGSFL